MEQYQYPEYEVVRFESVDVIRTSYSNNGETLLDPCSFSENPNP